MRLATTIVWGLVLVLAGTFGGWFLRESRLQELRRTEYISVQLPSPPPTFLPGKPIPMPPETSYVHMDSLEALELDSLRRFAAYVQTPYYTLYEDSIRRTRIDSYPYLKMNRDSTFYKPFTLPVQTVTYTEGGDAWYIRLGIAGAAYYLGTRTR